MKCSTAYPSLRLIVMPQEEVRNNFGRKMGTTPALRVEFSKTGVWDSTAPGVQEMFREYARRVLLAGVTGPELTAQLVREKTDEVAREVEEYLTSHAERGYRFHIDDAPSDPVPETKVVATCIAPKVDPETKESMICGQPAKEGSDYCEDCEPGGVV